MTKSQVKTTTNDVSRREILAGAIGAATAAAALGRQPGRRRGC
ncbi:hypothetical protein Q1M65_28585 [Sinorhizobium meliloti]|nr:hypothetical protein Q1M65_28585 [Sinorhizobium meliloti]